jgi:hypothetical protein
MISLAGRVQIHSKVLEKLRQTATASNGQRLSYNGFPEQSREIGDSDQTGEKGEEEDDRPGGGKSSVGNYQRTP